MSDRMTSEVINGIIDLMRFPAYDTVSKALWGFIVKQDFVLEPKMVLKEEIQTADAMKLLNPELSNEDASAFAALVHGANNVSIGLMAIQNAIEFED